MGGAAVYETLKKTSCGLNMPHSPITLELSHLLVYTQTLPEISGEDDQQWASRQNWKETRPLLKKASTLWKKEHWGPWLKFKTCEMTYVHRQNIALRLKILLLAGSMWYKYGLYTGMV